MSKFHEGDRVKTTEDLVNDDLSAPAGTEGSVEGIQGAVGPLGMMFGLDPDTEIVAVRFDDDSLNTEPLRGIPSTFLEVTGKVDDAQVVSQGAAE